MGISTVAFLTSSHSPFDDRIFYHQAKSLAKNFKVVIISSTENILETFGNISIVSVNHQSSDKKRKIEFFRQTLTQFNPELIICSEPLTILAALKYKKEFQQKVKIVYDITEWYPSKKNLEGLSGFQKFSVFFKLLFANIYVSARCDGFVFGEHYKSLPYCLFILVQKMGNGQLLSRFKIHKLSGVETKFRQNMLGLCRKNQC